MKDIQSVVIFLTILFFSQSIFATRRNVHKRLQHSTTHTNYDVSIVALPTGPTCARNLVKAKCKMNIIVVTDMNRRKVKI